MATKKVELRLQEGNACTVDADLWRLWLEVKPEAGLAMRARIDPDRPIAWRELDKLRALVELEYQGRDAGVADYATRRKGLKTLRWIDHRAARIELGKSAFPDLAPGLSLPITPDWVSITPAEAAGTK